MWASMRDEDVLIWLIPTKRKILLALTLYIQTVKSKYKGYIACLFKYVLKLQDRIWKCRLFIANLPELSWIIKLLYSQRMKWNLAVFHSDICISIHTVCQWPQLHVCFFKHFTGWSLHLLSFSRIKESTLKKKRKKKKNVDANKASSLFKPTDVIVLYCADGLSGNNAGKNIVSKLQVKKSFFTPVCRTKMENWKDAH